jgi:hypothetical protein
MYYGMQKEWSLCQPKPISEQIKTSSYLFLLRKNESAKNHLTLSDDFPTASHKYCRLHFAAIFPFVSGSKRMDRLEWTERLKDA